MKKNIKKVLSLALVLVMLCSMMSISVFAEDDPYVTVYITRGMFTPGGYNPQLHEPKLQEYVGGIPGSNNYFNGLVLPNGQYFSAQTIKISDINAALSAARTCYGGTGLPSTPNVLDAIYVAITMPKVTVEGVPHDKYTPIGGWDTWGNGGYISYFTPDGTTNTDDPDEFYDSTTEVTYDIYSGTGWQIACTQNGTLSEISTYGTNYALFSGMKIVFDLSYYEIYYPQI